MITEEGKKPEKIETVAINFARYCEKRPSKIFGLGYDELWAKFVMIGEIGDEEEFPSRTPDLLEENRKLKNDNSLLILGNAELRETIESKDRELSKLRELLDEEKAFQTQPITDTQKL